MDLSESWKNIASKFFLLIGIGMIIFGAYLQYSPPATSDDGLIIQPNNSMDQIASNSSEASQKVSSNAPSASIPSNIKVDVSGAVVKSGVFELPFNARLTVALDAAQGLSKSADTAWVARNLNLATKLYDGDKIYIPSKGELKSPNTIQATTVPSSTSLAYTNPVPQVAGITTGAIGLTSSSTSQSNTPSPAPAQSDGKISVNTSSIKELDTLPGVGEVTAQKIIDNRPYTKLEELKEKKAVNKSTYEKILDKIKL